MRDGCPRSGAAIRAGSYQLQVPEHKFKSHPGVPPARLTELAHSPLVPSMVCSMLPRGIGPHLRPQSESSRVGGFDPAHHEGALRRGGSCERCLDRRSRVGVDEVPGPGGVAVHEVDGVQLVRPSIPSVERACTCWVLGPARPQLPFLGRGRTRRGCLGGGIWSPGPCVPGAKPLGAQAGPRVGPGGPAETGSGKVCRPDQGDVVESKLSESGRGRRDPACTEGT